MGCHQFNLKVSMCHCHRPRKPITFKLRDGNTMVMSITDLLTVSVTINWCVLCFNVVPKVRSLVVQKACFKRFRRLRELCRWYGQTPLVLARVVTEQFVVWLLVLCSLTAMFATDVVKHPFKGATSGSLPGFFIEIILGINIGKYLFILMLDIFLVHTIETVRFRAELIHHLVTVVCYSLFLAYNQNVLLGLIGILMETTTVFESAGRCLKEQDKRNTKHYRRLMLSSCAVTICFRGIIPVVFLIIATLQQTPFSMDYAPLTVFFLSIIFFSVVNVWLILTGFQRLVKLLGDKSLESCGTEIPPRTSDGRTFYHSTARHIEVSKNNLGYVRPYENKNISNTLNDIEKSNLNNSKNFPKETLNNQIHIDILSQPDTLKEESKDNIVMGISDSNRSSELSSSSFIRSNNESSIFNSNLRESGESSASENSAGVLFHVPNIGQNNVVAMFTRRSDSRPSMPRSLSVEDIHHNQDNCLENTSINIPESSF